MRHALAIAMLFGCEHVSDLADPPSLIAPDAPEIDSIRSTSTVHEPPPPGATLGTLVGIGRGTAQWFLALSPHQRHEVRVICRMRAADPCAGLLPRHMAEEPDPMDAMISAIPGAEGYIDGLCNRMNPSRGCMTPLVVTFASPAIELRAATARFAFAPGMPVATDWPTEATPWIAIDRDGDGAITSGAELFGDSTRLPDGSLAKNGFSALAALDDNADGVIDARDRAFAKLVLWRDDGDRESTPGELRPLATEIVSISLAYESRARCENGNCEGERAAIVWRDGERTRTGTVVDLYLRSR